MKKFLCISLLLVCLLVVFSACGEGTPAETTGEVTTQPMTGEATTQAVTTEQTTAEVTTQPVTTLPPTGHFMCQPFTFYSLSDFYLYMEECPTDEAAYDVSPSFPYGCNEFSGYFFRLELLLPSLLESEQYYFDVACGNDIYRYGHAPYYEYVFRHNDQLSGGSIYISIRTVSENDEKSYDRPSVETRVEYDEELECVLVKNEANGLLEAAFFYSLEGYEVEIDFPSPYTYDGIKIYTPEAQEILLASDVTELKEILENPTFSCERLRIISETLRAMND